MFRKWEYIMYANYSDSEKFLQSITIHTTFNHHSDVIMGAMASLITSLTIVYSPVHSGADQRKHQSSAPLAFVRGIHRWSVNSPHKWPVTRKIFPFDDVIMWNSSYVILHCLSHSKTITPFTTFDLSVWILYHIVTLISYDIIYKMC